MSLKASDVFASLHKHFDEKKQNQSSDSIAKWLKEEIDNPSISNNFSGIQKLNVVDDLIEEDEFLCNLGVSIVSGHTVNNPAQLIKIGKTHFSDYFTV